MRARGVEAPARRPGRRGEAPGAGHGERARARIGDEAQGWRRGGKEPSGAGRGAEAAAPGRTRGADASPATGEAGGPPPSADARRAWDAAAAVLDPEVPCITVADLGILRDVRLVGGVAVARLSPTYSGCPAVLAIELAVEAALREAGFEARTERVLSPPWTTDWITEEGRGKLRAYGIAPPEGPAGKAALFGAGPVACPRCGSRDTEELSAFGSTACKAQWRCRACLEPFDHFKCI